MTNISQGHRWKDLPKENSYCERCGMWLSYFVTHRNQSGASCEDEKKRSGNKPYANIPKEEGR